MPFPVAFGNDLMMSLAIEVLSWGPVEEFVAYTMLTAECHQENIIISVPGNLLRERSHPTQERTGLAPEVGRGCKDNILVCCCIVYSKLCVVKWLFTFVQVRIELLTLIS